MSKGPTLTGELNLSKIFNQYINIKIEKHDWCSYDGECPSARLLHSRETICLLCEYKKNLDIPKIIMEREEKNKSKE